MDYNLIEESLIYKYFIWKITGEVFPKIESILRRNAIAGLLVSFYQCVKSV